MSSKKKQDLLNKKSQFYVEFLGWMECVGLRGRKYTDGVIRELRKRQHKMAQPPRLTIQVNKKELKVSQDFEEKGKRKNKTVKFPSIPSRDITYVTQTTRADGRLDDVVACIYLGYVPRTNRYVHVHVYRFDAPDTAHMFVRILNAIIEQNGHRLQQIEMDLIEKGEIEPVLLHRLNSSDGMSEFDTNRSAPDSNADSLFDSNASFGSDRTPPSFGEDIDPDLQSLHESVPFDSVTDELKMRLRGKTEPLLLPPKDYDTISRSHGNIKETEKRRCMNIDFVGPSVLTPRDRNGSGESGVDVASPQEEPEINIRDLSISGNNNMKYSAIGDEMEFLNSPRSPPTDRNTTRREGYHVRQVSHSSHGSYRSMGSSNSGDDYNPYPTPSSPRVRREPDEEVVILRRPVSMQHNMNLNRSMPASGFNRSSYDRADPYWRDERQRASDYEYDPYHGPREEVMVKRTNSFYS